MDANLYPRFVPKYPTSPPQEEATPPFFLLGFFLPCGTTSNSVVSGYQGILVLGQVYA